MDMDTFARYTRSGEVGSEAAPASFRLQLCAFPLTCSLFRNKAPHKLHCKPRPLKRFTTSLPCAPAPPPLSSPPARHDRARLRNTAYHFPPTPPLTLFFRILSTPTLTRSFNILLSLIKTFPSSPFLSLPSSLLSCLLSSLSPSSGLNYGLDVI